MEKKYKAIVVDDHEGVRDFIVEALRARSFEVGDNFTGTKARTDMVRAHACASDQDPVPILSPPFNGGIWLAGDGPVNDSNHRRSILAVDGHIYSPERFASDWVKVGPNGDSRHEGTSKNENCLRFVGADLFAGNSIHRKTTFRPPGSSVRVLPLPALELPDIFIGAPMRIIAVDNFSPSRVASGSVFSRAAKIEMRFSVKGTASKFVR